MTITATMMSIRKKLEELGVFRIAMVLLALATLSSMWALSRTFAATPGSRTLTYTTNKLEWDSVGGVNADGSAKLKLFGTEHNGTVRSSDGDNVVAPGTDWASSVVLRNTVGRSIRYTAIAYSTKESTDIRMDPVFSGDGTDTTSYQLPASAQGAKVLGAKTGTLAGNSEATFRFNTSWSYEGGSEVTDAADTALGRRAENEDIEVTVGFYIVVEDEGGGNTPVTPETPKTGDAGKVLLYGSLFAVCGVLMVMLMKKDDEETEEDSRAL